MLTELFETSINEDPASECPSSLLDPSFSESVFYLELLMVKKKKKKIFRSSQDSNLGPLNSGHMLLPTEPLELWHWSRG